MIKSKLGFVAYVPSKVAKTSVHHPLPFLPRPVQIQSCSICVLAKTVFAETFNTYSATWGEPKGAKVQRCKGAGFVHL